MLIQLESITNFVLNGFSFHSRYPFSKVHTHVILMYAWVYWGIHKYDIVFEYASVICVCSSCFFFIAEEAGAYLYSWNILKWLQHPCVCPSKLVYFSWLSIPRASSPPLLQSAKAKPFTSFNIGQSHLENQFVLVMTQIFMTMQE